MKELIHKQVINHKGDLVAFEFVTKNIIKQVNDEIKDFNIIATIFALKFLQRNVQNVASL